jgi:peptidoglycan/LPS O-acetylase OafA/YrhL
MVVISHLEWMKFEAGLPNILDFVGNGGSLGVSLFFVLSGFLITFLLLQEKKDTNDVSIKKFYIRRILRIWPVYYLTVILAFFVLPYFITLPGHELEMYNGQFFAKFSLFFFLMANVSYSMFPIVPFASQLWSIGVEEQFYLMWPVIVKKRSVNFHKILVYIILIIVVLRIVLEALYTKFPDSGKLHIILNFVYHFRIQDMAIGGLGAMILFYKKEVILNFLCSREIEIINLIITIVSIYSAMHFGMFNEEIYSLFFLIIILNAAYNKNTVLKLEGRIFKFLGQISYGIYVYQILAIRIAFILVFHIFKLQGDLVGNVVYYTLGTGITILFAALSYYIMERWFLSFKDKFTLVASN